MPAGAAGGAARAGSSAARALPALTVALALALPTALPAAEPFPPDAVMARAHGAADADAPPPRLADPLPLPIALEPGDARRVDEALFWGQVVDRLGVRLTAHFLLDLPTTLRVLEEIAPIVAHDAPASGDAGAVLSAVGRDLADRVAAALAEGRIPPSRLATMTGDPPPPRGEQAEAVVEALAFLALRAAVLDGRRG